jgi:ABC-type Fe3+ transport system permease subunit
LVPTALPAIVVGLGFLVMFSAPRLPLSAPAVLLIASVVVVYLPVAVRIGIDALTAIDPAVEEAAVNLGADRLRVLSRIVRPLVSRATIGMFLSFCMSGMLSVSAVVFLVRPGFELGSVTVLHLTRSGRPGPACAVTTVLFFGVVLMALALRWRGLRQHHGLHATVSR